MKHKLLILTTITISVYLIVPLIEKEAFFPSWPSQVEIQKLLTELSLYCEHTLTSLDYFKNAPLIDFNLWIYCLAFLTAIVETAGFLREKMRNHRDTVKIKTDHHMYEGNTSDKSSAPTVGFTDARWLPPDNLIQSFNYWFDYDMQKAAEIICKFYRAPPIPIVVRDFSNGNILGQYVQPDNRIYLYRGGVNRFVALHELYHHLQYCGKSPFLTCKEELAADTFANTLLLRSGALD